MSIRYWLVVQPLDRAREQVAAGIVQGVWGRYELVAPMTEADGVVLYSPRMTNPEGEPLRAVVAAGRILTAEPFRAGGRGESPWRHRVAWLADAQIAPIRPLRDLLDFVRTNPNWGELLRPGVMELSRRDFEVLEDAVRRPAPEPTRFAMDAYRPLDAEPPRDDGPRLIR